MNFKNKTALITGAAVGIGRATAINLAMHGASLVLVDLDFEKLESVKQELSQYTKEVLIFKCDVSDEESVNNVVKEATAHFGKIDILVNNAAIWRSMKLFTDITSDEWKKYLDINVLGVVYFSKAVLPKMLEHSYGRIINVASITGVYGSATMVHYSTTKGALIAMTKALAKEVTAKGVLVNCVAPGSVSPADIPDVNHTQPTPLSFIGRTGSDMENANLICFLASDEASYIAGQTIQIDGCRKSM